MPIKKIKPKKKVIKEFMTEWIYTYLTTGKEVDVPIEHQWDLAFGKKYSKYIAEATERYILEHPFHRPLCWWQTREENRLLLSGKLDPKASVYAYDRGLPCEQITVGPDGFLVSWNKIDPRKVFYDPNDPPIWETELQYLERLGLLTESEKRLKI